MNSKEKELLKKVITHDIEKVSIGLIDGGEATGQIASFSITERGLTIQGCGFDFFGETQEIEMDDREDVTIDTFSDLVAYRIGLIVLQSLANAGGHHKNYTRVIGSFTRLAKE